MKYIGSREYDKNHIQDDFIPFQVMKRKKKCQFVENIAKSDFVEKFTFKCEDGFELHGSKEKDLEKWKAHYTKEDAHFKEASYKVGEHTIKIKFSKNEEILLIKEKTDRRSYWTVLDSIERQTIDFKFDD